MAKISEKAKVYELEEAVSNKDVEKIKDLYEKYGSFEFTARALGLACAAGNYEAVKVLVDKGATFEFEYSPQLNTKYHVAYSGRSSFYEAQYGLMLAGLGLAVQTKGGIDSREYLFGDAYEVEKSEDYENEVKMIVDYLLKKKVKGFDTKDALYYSILWGNYPVSDRLLEKGKKLPE